MQWNQEVLLHDHLDGSATLMPVLRQLFELSHKPYPFSGTLEEQHTAVREIFQNVQLDIVERFKHTTGVMQSRETLALAAQSYVCERARQGFRYCEATIAPQYHVFGGLKIRDVVDALIEGIMRGESQYPQIEVNLLFTIGREISPDEAIRLVEEAAACDRRYVVGIGLVCDEAEHPPEKHTAMFRRAKALGFKTAAHAGEWIKNRRPEETNTTEKIRHNAEQDLSQLTKNIYTAIFDLAVDRIGHAIPLAYDPDLLRIVKKKHIGIEGCPGSNFASNLIHSVEYLKIRELLQAGILYTLNPDDDLFLPNLQQTFTLCDEAYRFNDLEKRKLRMNGWLCRFGQRKQHRIS